MFVLALLMFVAACMYVDAVIQKMKQPASSSVV